MKSTNAYGIISDIIANIPNIPFPLPSGSEFPEIPFPRFPW